VGTCYYGIVVEACEETISLLLPFGMSWTNSMLWPLVGSLEHSTSNIVC
jgi:hypothetical protein